MERNEGIVRWSPNPSRDQFMVINLNSRAIQLFEAKGQAQPRKFEYQRISKHHEIPPLNTYDWSPAIPGLVVVGTSHGEVSLLRVDDDSNASLTLPLKLQRSCQSVAFNTTGLLAVGLDRIRNDSCLQIWDVNQRLADWDSAKPGWGKLSMNIDPKKKLEGSVSVTSIRFFEDQPQTLVVGVKNQSVRVHDLRDPNFSVMTFQTRCNNNLSIDFADPNYFASSSLDHPGVVVWDRRVSSRSAASPMYLESIDQEEIPWGAALKLDRAIETEQNVNIRTLRFCREHRGTLGVLSSAGQLQVFKTNKEYVEPGSTNDIKASPELLEVKKSLDLEYPCFDPNHKRKPEDRIISFDWLNLGTPELDPRVIALRANGSFEILQTPAATHGQLSQLIPWKTPQRVGDPYMTLMDFADQNEREAMLGPLFATAAKAGIPIFGPDRLSQSETKAKLDTTIKKIVHSKEDPVVNLLASTDSNMALSLTSLGLTKFPEVETTRPGVQSELNKTQVTETLNTVDTTHKFYTSKELHDISHYSVLSCIPRTKPNSELFHNIMLRRAVDGYLFNCKKNMAVVANDKWLQGVWEWVACAEDSAKDDGMVSAPLDLSYMGVYTIWMNILGHKAKSRLIDSSIIPEPSQWERLISNINKHAGRPDFEGLATEKPHHRILCLATCGLVKSPIELEDDLNRLVEQRKFTTAAAWALFEGIPKRAVSILKGGGTDLLFVAMALDIKIKSNTTLDLDTGEWSKALENHPQMADDPYLRAIYGYVATGDWAAIADEASLPLRDRVGVALRNFSDAKLTYWLTEQMEEVIRTGDIEGIVLAGITDDMVDILAKYVENFMDYQTAILVVSHCYPRYINDIRCSAWRKNYQDFLQRHKQYILRVKFEQQSTIKSRLRDGTSVIKPPPRQVTIRCLNCDAQSVNDLSNSGEAPHSAPGPSSTIRDTRNPLMASGINAGLSCPRCGSHLSRCAVCMEYVGVPRSDRPGLSHDPAVRRMANFPTFCLMCKHVMHMDHSVAWFGRHIECPVPECRCQCNEQPGR